ncbi:hypothetical protein [Pseudomonas canadensis]|uniref:hypothetical protein n=1 Tax=Pseudomonas canadensis TaxID=915099 RepID=UPI00273624DD|nr:hypothetical protein [Pseudomonas canadensis]WLH32668.1 hypothetical protein PSH56_13365 [Pseudomonas canadensis]
MIKVLPNGSLQALCVEAETKGIALSDLESICSEFRVGPETVLNELSLTVAEGYMCGTLGYEFCDGVMNGIVNAILDLGMIGEIPHPAFALYQAFDQGEWSRSSDSPDTDLGEKYTTPTVLEILRNLER